MDHQLFNLVEYGTVLSTRERGREAADRLQEALVGGNAVVLNFAGVEVASPSFLDEVLTRLRGLLSGTGSAVVVVAGLNEDVSESLEFVLDRRKMALAALDHGKLSLLGGSSQLQETLAEAGRLGSFKAPELAESLKIKLPNLHQRLKSLAEGGAIGKVPRGASGGGRGGDFWTFGADGVRLEEMEPRKLVHS
jgi:hypothetical protein